ncbi:MAG: hypothetical protein GY950_02930, partial [bacterium]|nr:hypothetical protein [bacterium]
SVDFNFEELERKKTDLVGPEGIKVFRIEKYAGEYEIIISDFLYSLLKRTLKKEKISHTDLGRKRIKGFDETIGLYKLVFPVHVTMDASNLLAVKMAELEEKTKEIPVFGDLYPAMSMEENFIDLDG